MFKNYFKIAWRNLLKDRQYTFLNLAGLATGLTCTLFIYLWVTDELSFDKFHEKDRQLYQVMEHRNAPGHTDISDESSGMLAETLQKEMPEVEYAAAEAPASWFQKFTLTVGEKSIKATGQYVGKDYFNIFSFPLIQGNKDKVLADKSYIAISENLAQNLFHTTDAIGKTILFEHNKPFYVSGVFKNVPYHSTEQFDFLLPFDYYKDIQQWVTTWVNTGPHNFIVLKKGTNIDAFNYKIRNIIRKHCEDTTRTAFVLPFSDNYLYNTFEHGARQGGRIEYVRMFSIIALFILIIACINFMNLSTARASGRLKEIGIKKVVGASRKQLIFQFIFESMLLTSLAVALALAAVWLLLPRFNQITGKEMALAWNARLVLSLLIITLITGGISGSYPALYLSGFNPISVLKGKLTSSVGELLARKGLVVFQFTISIVFIIAVMVVYKQIQYIQTADMGYNKDHVIRFDSEGKLMNHQEQFVSELKNIPGVVNASGTWHNIIGRNFSTIVEWPGKDPGENMFFEGAGVGYDFTETMDMHMKEGRSFSRKFGADSSKVLLNEAAIRYMRMKDPVGKTVTIFGNNMQIIGVVRDFHFESVHEPVKPMFMILDAQNSNPWYKIIVRIQAGKEGETIDRIRNLYTSYNPGYIFDFSFLDEAYQKQYAAEKRVGVLSKYFAGLAILISCLGLFGLAAFTARKRQKEITIRKVVGATVSTLMLLLSIDFLKLVLLAIGIAFPLSWWVMSKWLNSFAYRVQMSVWMFLVAAVSIFLITLITVSFQSVKAALANPVKNLRSE